MRTLRRRTQIEIETHEVTIVRLGGDRSRLVCEDCGRDLMDGDGTLLSPSPVPPARYFTADEASSVADKSVVAPSESVPAGV